MLAEDLVSALDLTTYGVRVIDVLLILFNAVVQ